MKILTIADEEAKSLYAFYTEGMLDEYDLIISCGDLSRNYLEFLVTMSHCPLLYVHGNHDDYFQTDPPEGCICIDGEIYIHEGVRILGLGGSYRYKDSGINMYTEKEMKKRISRLRFQLWKNKGFDILITHAPARGINDEDSISHRGFKCFVDLLKKYSPKYFVHGHRHRNYGAFIPQKTNFQDVTVINAYEYYVIEL